MVWCWSGIIRCWSRMIWGLGRCVTGKCWTVSHRTGSVFGSRWDVRLGSVGLRGVWLGGRLVCWLWRVISWLWRWSVNRLGRWVINRFGRWTVSRLGSWCICGLGMIFGFWGWLVCWLRQVLGFRLVVLLRGLLIRDGFSFISDISVVTILIGVISDNLNSAIWKGNSVFS